MKPEFFKPFNIEHAKAGAPYSRLDGLEATVLKWDGRDEKYPLIGIAGMNDVPSTWCRNGIFNLSSPDSDGNLVMLALGMIDGKPVFVGDELVLKEASRIDGYEAYTGISTVLPGWANEWTPEIWRWPALENAYPKSQMTSGELYAANNHPNSTNTAIESLTYVANVALRHAIDSGQVVTKEEYDRITAQYVELQGVSLELSRDITHRAARDIAIAMAVRHASREASIPDSTAYGRISSLNLSEIIAKVKS